MRYFRNQRKTPPPLVREVVKRSTERVAGLIPFGDATEDIVENGTLSSPGESDKLIEAVSVVDVAPVARNRRTSRTGLWDHGRDLTGLRDDDHNLYYHLDGIRALSGDMPLGATPRNFTYAGNIAVQFQPNANATQYPVLQTLSAGFPAHFTCGGNLTNQDLHVEGKGTGRVVIANTQFAGDLKTDNISTLYFDMYRVGHTLLHIRNTHASYEAHLQVEGGITAGALAITGDMSVHDHEADAGGGTLDHNLALTGLQGGTATEYYHLTASEHTELNAWLDDVTLADGGGMTLGDDLGLGFNSIVGVNHLQMYASSEIQDFYGNPNIKFYGFTTAAVNYLYITNAFTGVSPSLVAAGADTNIDLELGSKGTGLVKSLDSFDVTGDITLTGTVDGRDVDADGTKLDGVDSSARAAHAMLDGDVHTDSVADAVTRGSLIVGNATPAWDELPFGAWKQYLICGPTDPVWSALDISHDTSPTLGGELDCNGHNIDDNSRAYVLIDNQLYVSETMGILTAPISTVGLTLAAFSTSVRYGIYGGVTYSGTNPSVYGLFFGGTHTNASPADDQHAFGVYVPAINQGIAGANKDITSTGLWTRATNSGAQSQATATMTAQSLIVAGARAGTGNNTAGNFYGMSLHVYDATPPAGTPTTNLEWCALFEGDIQVNSDKKLILEGSATIKGDTYLVYDSAAVTMDFFHASVKRLSIGPADFTVPTDDGINYDPSADIDVDVATVKVTGNPKLWWDESEDAFRITHRLMLLEGVQTKYATDNVADPPTDAQLDTAFGDPTVVGSGFVGVLDDNDAGTDCYICWTTGTAGEWFYTKGTKAV